MTGNGEVTSHSRLAALYIAAIVAAGGCVTGLSLWSVGRTEFGTTILAWAALSILTLTAGRFTVKLPFLGCRVSISDGFIFLSVILFGAELATLTAAIDGYAASTRQKGAWTKRLFNSAGMALSVFFSARLYAAAVNAGGIWGDIPVAQVLLPVLLLGTAQFILNTAIVSGVLRLKEGVSMSTVWCGALRWTGTAYLAGAVAACAVSLIVQHAGFVSTFTILPFPALLFMLYQDLVARTQASKFPARN